ncbi:MAG: hypothetical protein MJ182_00730 [Treponema sp.]|nr:hypothetical protein [Treponema sp.]
MWAEIPESLYGIWEGKDRYVFFENVKDEDRIVIILKDYYGWYLDRVVEHEDYDVVYGKDFPRSRNAATTKKSIFVALDSTPLWLSEGNSNDFSGAYELKLIYGKSDVSYVPFAIIDGKMYLEFWISDAEQTGFWKGNVVSEGIKVSDQKEQEELFSWFIDEQNNKFYKIRYWKTQMDYDSELQAVLESEYYVSKHIISAQNTYTCVPGRRVNIRNIDKTPVSIPFDGKDVLYNEEKTLCAVNNVYLNRLADKNTFEQLMEIVRIQNSRRKPDPPPLFPPKDLDFHWDLIDYLEKDDALIQEVRKRQKEFGVRGKDIGR